MKPCSTHDPHSLLAQITAPHFVAGLLLSENRVQEAAPIIRYMIGWPRARVREYCHRKGWQVRIVGTNKGANP